MRECLLDASFEGRLRGEILGGSTRRQGIGTAADETMLSFSRPGLQSGLSPTNAMFQSVGVYRAGSALLLIDAL